MPAPKLSEEKLIEAYERHRQGEKLRELAAEYGQDHSSLYRRFKTLEQKDVMRGKWPTGGGNEKIPEPYHVKGKSQYYDKDGNIAGVWVKSDLNKERWFQIAEQAAKDFYDDLPPIQIAPAPTNYDTDIIPWFNIGDAHVGMLAHGDETGQSFDLKIAERELCEAMAILIDECDPHERCVIQDMGDFTHYQDFKAESESGHIFDYDNRYPKMIRVAIRIFRFIVERALTKFKNVDVIINQGNHSRSNDIWMRELIRVAYGHTGRVNALNNESVFIPYRMGNTFVMCHHSDKCKPNRLCDVMVSDFRQDYGESTYHYIDIGHIHTRTVSKEYADITVESWNQLAAADKYAHDGGWRSRSCLHRIDRSKTYGEVGRRRLPVEEVWDKVQKCAKGKNVGKRREVYTV